MSDTPLRERLHAAAPSTYPGVDLDAAITSGRRTIRRRSITTTVVATCALIAVVLGGSSLTSGRLSSAPTPAGDSSLSATAPIRGSVDLGGGSTGSAFNVTVASGTGDAEGQLTVNYRDSSGSIVDTGLVHRSHPVSTWSTKVGAPYVLGVVPSASALDRIDASAVGASTFSTPEVKPIPHTDFSAFLITYSDATTDHIVLNELLWFDAMNRPVDHDGNVGSAVTVGGHTIWITLDGREFGDEDGSTVVATTIPVLPSGGDATTTTQDWNLAVLAPFSAHSGSLQLGDGQTVPFESVPLSGTWRVLDVHVTTAKNVTPVVESITWGPYAEPGSDGVAEVNGSATTVLQAPLGHP